MESIIILFIIIGMVATWVLGIMKHRAAEGIIGGLLLRWRAFLWLLFQKPPTKCPECRSWIIKGIRRCPKCGGQLA